MTSLPVPPRWSEITKAIAAAWPPSRWCNLGVVVGCSGGADSVGLLRGLAAVRQQHADGQRAEAWGELTVGHFNHGLRGTESDADQEFVCRLARHLGLPVVTARSRERRRDEAALRQQRFDFLTATANQRGARYVALAQTLDDNVETMLHHLMRGTGPRGLAGMAPSRPIRNDLVLVRPLLRMRRATLRQGLQDIDQEWREDSSNWDLSYRRNWIRHQLLPLAESQYPHAVAAMGRAIEAQRQWRDVLDRQAECWLDTHLILADSVRLRCDSTADPAILIAALHLLWDRLQWPRGSMTFDHWSALAERIGGGTTASLEPGSLCLPAAITVVLEDGHVRLDRDLLPLAD